MGVNVVNWLIEADYKAFMQPKDIKVERLDLTSQQKKMILLVLLFMPLAIAAYGGFVWIKEQVL